MRLLTFPTIFLASTLSTIVMADDLTHLNYNIANVQASATRQVSNDEMHAVLFIEKINKQPAELAAQISQQMNQALVIAKKYSQVKVETGAQTTFPIYDNDNQKLKNWRGRAEIQIQSKDFKAASQLINELQANFQTQSINFSISDEQKKKVENELIIEASKNFQQRAQILTKAWNKSSYQLVNINIDSNNSYPQQLFATRAAMAKLEVASADSQNMAAGESTITVSANGSIQFK